jgi:hypothetical protein
MKKTSIPKKVQGKENLLAGIPVRLFEGEAEPLCSGDAGGNDRGGARAGHRGGFQVGEDGECGFAFGYFGRVKTCWKKKRVAYQCGTIAQARDCIPANRASYTDHA